MIEPSLPIYDKLHDQIEQDIEDLMNATGIRYCMLVDRKGFVLSHKEALWAPRPPALDSIASLVASNAAATTALAGLLGETTFSEQIHQGENGILYIESVGHHAILTLIFDTKVPIGRVKVYVKKTITLLNTRLEILNQIPRPKLDQNFNDTANTLLDELMG
jgi:predicted regulator of Ras-like GTPase activity (Roadblock/LC7/MglB family)